MDEYDCYIPRVIDSSSTKKHVEPIRLPEWIQRHVDHTDKLNTIAKNRSAQTAALIEQRKQEDEINTQKRLQSTFDDAPKVFLFN